MLLGAITGARGLKGEVILKSFTQSPEAIANYGPLQSEDGAVKVVINRLSPVKGGFAAKLKGVNDRNGAEALKGIGLYVDRDQLGAVEEDEFFHADLIGLDVVRGDDGVIGKVTAVQNFGASDLLEIALTAAKGTVLLPFTKEAVPVLDLAAGRLEVNPPLGLWDKGGTPDDGQDEAKTAKTGQKGQKR